MMDLFLEWLGVVCRVVMGLAVTLAGAAAVYCYEGGEQEVPFSGSVPGCEAELYSTIPHTYTE